MTGSMQTELLWRRSDVLGIVDWRRV